MYRHVLTIYLVRHNTNTKTKLTSNFGNISDVKKGISKEGCFD